MNDRWIHGSRRPRAILLAAVCSIAAMPPISMSTRAALNRTIGAQGVYVSEESAHKFVFPRTDVSLQVAGQHLSPAEAPKSWATFSPSMHHEAMVNGELILLDDEVNPVMTVALMSGLDVTGLGATLLSEQPRLLTLNVTAEGTFQALAVGVRRALDEVQHVRATGRPSTTSRRAVPLANAIDAAPLNAILSMRGAAHDGIYRAAIGKVALVNGTPIGREMGVSTTVSMFGANDRALADAEMVVSGEELRRVLSALRTKNLSITSIRNHLVGEHPPYIFVKVWGEGPAVDLAKSLRYALDVEVGAARLPAK